MTAPESEGASLVCPECGEEITHANPSVARMSLGRHRKIAHGVQGKPRRPKKGRPPSRPEQPTAIRVVKDATEELSSSSGSPTVDALTKAFGRGLGSVSTVAASWAAESDPTITDEKDLDAVTDYLSLSPDAAKEIAYPFARMFAKSKLNKRYGRAIVDNVDVVSAAAELLDYGRRWNRYLRERKKREKAMGIVNARVVSDVVVPPSAPPPSPSATASTNGHIVSHDEVRRMVEGRP